MKINTYSCNAKYIVSRNSIEISSKFDQLVETFVLQDQNFLEKKIFNSENMNIRFEEQIFNLEKNSIKEKQNKNIYLITTNAELKLVL